VRRERGGGGEREGGGEKNTKQNNKTATWVILLYFLDQYKLFVFCLFFVLSAVFLGISGLLYLTLRLYSTGCYKGKITTSLQKEGFIVKKRSLQHACEF
jgi:hypothetical protein